MNTETDTIIFSLGSYTGLVLPKTDAEVSEAEYQEAISEELRRHTKLVEVSKKAEKGDTVNIDYAGFLGEKQFEGGTAAGYDLLLGSGSFIPGFEDQLIGTAKGDHADVRVTFPENYRAKELAGKETVFHCTINAVKQEKVPELTDEYVFSTYLIKTKEEFETFFRGQLEAQKKLQAAAIQKNEAVRQLMESSSLIPAVDLVDIATNALLSDFSHELSAQGADIEVYCEFLGIELDDLKKKLKPQAASQATAMAILLEIARIESLQATEEEMNAQIAAISRQYQRSEADVRSQMGEQGLRAMANDLTAAHVLDFILSHAEIR